MNTLFCRIVLIMALLLVSAVTTAETIRIAVASNFIAPMKALIKEFESQTGHKVKASYGSSGKIFAQIQHGAPYDVFLSADQEKPKRLEEMGLAIKGSRFTYAQGRLVLWSSQENAIGNEQRLKAGDFSRLAIANPKLAPYGLAASQVLKSLKLETATKSKLIVGENISQAYQFVRSGNADLGFVALSQVMGSSENDGELNWIVPNSLYDPISQDAVLIKTNHSNVGRLFLDFIGEKPAKAILTQFGYL